MPLASRDDHKQQPGQRDSLERPALCRSWPQLIVGTAEAAIFRNAQERPHQDQAYVTLKAALE